MNHIGAKTEPAPSAWDQLAQTQNYDHPVVRQPTQVNANKPQIVNQQPPPVVQQQQQAPLPPPAAQQPTDPNKQPEYGEELHPELVNKNFMVYCWI